MTSAEIEKLLRHLLATSKLSDRDVLDLIYALIESIEDSCYGSKDRANKAKFERVYDNLFGGVFEDFIASYDWFDSCITRALLQRGKTIVEVSK